MTVSRIPLRKLAFTLFALAAAPALSASTVLYYQFNGAAGATATTIADISGNSNTGTATTFGGAGATIPVYSSTTVGTIITDGLNGPVINAANTSSLKFDNPIPSGNYATSAGGRVTAASSASLQPTSFTVEGFIRVESLIQFAGIVGKERESGGSTWLLDTSPTGQTGSGQPTNETLRGRFDQQVLNAGNVAGNGFNQNVSSSASITNPTSVLGDGWYHVAMTYDGTTDRATLFVNYTQVGTALLAQGEPGLVYNGGLFYIGGGGGSRGFDGLIDEVRLSDSVLAPGQFLYVAAAVPEPGRVLLLMLSGAMVLLRRRR